ncbi:Transposon Tf2-6 polyprotein [Eumeta japonica]|uniref:Transposon Tf2-6 polyprotein n=1 Tax=Eumeta variegata TaxID=151549 RepID=A0A4C1YQG0_EUMVA|nr:Transposon Tf2-6 polyprotein [Eumeta japonica]
MLHVGASVFCKFNGSYNAECAVRPPPKRVPAIPDDAMASVILFCDHMVAKMCERRKVFPVPPGASMKNSPPLCCESFRLSILWQITCVFAVVEQYSIHQRVQCSNVHRSQKDLVPGKLGDKWRTVDRRLFLNLGRMSVHSKECQESFDRIRQLLCSKPILRIFDPGQPIKIHTDASIKGVGAILKQEDKTGVSKPVAYFSKKLTESQKKKMAIYLECLAIKKAVKYWQHWLMGKEFVVYSDHKPLENLNIKARTDEELGDLMHYLSQYNFKTKYNPGQSNQEADCLSRNPVLEPDENTDDF